MKKQVQLNFKVTNSEKLMAGLTPLYSLTADKQLRIGAARDNDWRLSDPLSEIAAYHCRIYFSNGQFVVEDLCGDTKINGSSLPIGRNKKACLADNNSLEIGPYQLRVHSTNLDVLSESEMALLEQHFNLDEQLKEIDLAKLAAPATTQTIDEPLAALQQAYSRPQADDLLLIDEPHAIQRVTAQADSQTEINSAVNLKHSAATRYNTMSDNTIEALEQEIAQNSLEDLFQDQIGQPYDAGKISRGLGFTSGFNTIHLIPEELAQGLQAAIRGLLALHQQIAETRYSMMNKNLQPIEDNPLRLGLSYEATLQILFDKTQAGVHLTSAAAIEESLRIMRYHNDAVQQATNQALQQILAAFNPDVLLKRFSRYRRPDAAQTTETDAEWAWMMYRHYYDELISERQQGFEKLFWEIFEQAYDKTLRQKQFERE